MFRNSDSRTQVNIRLPQVMRGDDDHPTLPQFARPSYAPPPTLPPPERPRLTWWQMLRRIGAFLLATFYLIYWAFNLEKLVLVADGALHGSIRDAILLFGLLAALYVGAGHICDALQRYVALLQAVCAAGTGATGALARGLEWLKRHLPKD